MINCEFTAYLDPTVGSLIVKTLVNTFDNTALLGGFSTNPGGLGGWSPT